MLYLEQRSHTGAVTPLTDNAARAMGERVMALATRFAENPAEGAAEGYEPVKTFIRSPQEIGRPSYSAPGRSSYAAWLHAVARQFMPANRYRIDEGLGDGPENCMLVIYY